MKLYDLPAEVRRIELMLDESEGEVTPEIESVLNALEVEKARKVDWIGALVAESNREAEALALEVERLQSRALSHRRRAERLKAWLMGVLDAIGERKVAGSLFTASVCTNAAPSIRWKDPGPIPKAFQRVTVDLDGTKAREAHKAGNLPDGFEVVLGRHLRIG